MVKNVKKCWSTEERMDMVSYIVEEFGYTAKNAEKVAHLMEKLAINVDEALELVEFDKKPVDLNEKATKEVKKVQKMTAQAKKDLKESKKVAKAKADEVKSTIADGILSVLVEQGHTSPQLVKNGKICLLGTDGAYYTVTITKNKACPDGFEV